MKLSQFKFKLPEDQIALYPHSIYREFENDKGEKESFRITRRDECRLMVLHKKSQTIDMFKKDADGKPIEGEYLDFRNVLDYFDEHDNTTSRGRTLRFLYDCPHEEFKRELYSLGEAPLPRYVIDRREDHHATEDDFDDFQCIFAKNEGAVTAPATGLHFSRELMKRMEIKGINFAYITLHCGLGNFHDIEVEDLTKHKMDSEQMHIGAEACAIVNKTKQEGRHVCAVGTSVVKATETAVGTDGMLKEYEGWTNKFIFPPYDFGLADSMISNFYHPLSTLLMETCAFGGYDLVMEAYNLAVKHGYMFGCYGDALLIVND